MRISSTTTRLIVVTPLFIQLKVGVLSNPEHGVAMRTSGTAVRSVALYRMSAANSRSNFLTVPSLFVEEAKLEMMSSVQGWRHTRS